MQQYHAEITCVATGETRVRVQETVSLKHIDYIWSEGNYSCDCNRGLEFARAAGEEDPDHECGDELYHVKLIDRDGDCIYEDD
jgi:hypothetical protein